MEERLHTMGIRGLTGFHFNERDLLAYNHWDSSPSHLGVKTGEFLMGFLANKTADDLRAMASRLIPVKEDPPTPLTPALRDRLKTAGIEVVRHSKGELAYGGMPSLAGKVNWYSTLRDLQGSLSKTLSAGVILEANDFIKDGLFCEWAYIVNLDSGEIEIYRGFIKRDQPCQGRYAGFMPPPYETITRPNGKVDRIANEYRACTLAMTFPLSPEGAKEFFLACGGNGMEGGVPVVLKAKGGKLERGVFKPIPGLVWNEVTGESFREEGFTFTHEGKRFQTGKYGYAAKVEKKAVKIAA